MAIVIGLVRTVVVAEPPEMRRKPIRLMGNVCMVAESCWWTIIIIIGNAALPALLRSGCLRFRFVLASHQK
jgi:hypothetical protein